MLIGLKCYTGHRQTEFLLSEIHWPIVVWDFFRSWGICINMKIQSYFTYPYEQTVISDTIFFGTLTF